MKRFLLGVLVIPFLTASSFGLDPAAEKRREVLQLMELTGMVKLADQMLEGMIAQMQQAQKDLPPTFFDRFRQKAKADSLVDLMIPIYEKYYSLEDLKAINAFYQTPTGKRMLASLPRVTQEAMAVGQAWGEKLGREAAEEDAAARKKPAPKT